MVFDPFSLLAPEATAPAPTIIYQTVPAEASTILGIDEKYVIGVIIGIMVVLSIEELF